MGVALLRMPRGRNHLFPVGVPKKKKDQEGGNTTLQAGIHSADHVLQPSVPTGLIYATMMRLFLNLFGLFSVFRSMNGKKGIIDVWWLYDDGGIFKFKKK